MPALDARHETRTALPDSALEAGRSPGNASRGFADDYSRAQQAAAMANANHRNPDRIRKLYLEDASMPRTPPADPILTPVDEETRQMRQMAVAFKLTGIVVAIGLIATIALTA